GGIGGAVGLTVVGFVSETVRTVVVQRRGVAETAVAIQTQCAVGRAVHEDRGDRIAIDVAVVGQHARGNDGEGRVFRCGVGVVGHDGAGGAGRIVHRSDGDGDGGIGGAVGLTVVGFVSETVRTVVVQRRGVAETAVAIQTQCAVGR